MQLCRHLIAEGAFVEATYRNNPMAARDLLNSENLIEIQASFTDKTALEKLAATLEARGTI